MSGSMVRQVAHTLGSLLDHGKCTFQQILDNQACLAYHSVRTFLNNPSETAQELIKKLPLDAQWLVEADRNERKKHTFPHIPDSSPSGSLGTQGVFHWESHQNTLKN